MADTFGIILLTGPPGVGKTTLVRKVSEALLKNHSIHCNGFYTEEVRDPVSRERIGFDVTSFNQKMVPLARSGVKLKGPYVGKYSVYIREFEEFVLPILTASLQSVLIIDEIGKMELKSRPFELAVRSCINRSTILATIPLETKQPLELVEHIKQLPQAKVIKITKENRNNLLPIIVENIVQIMNR